MVDFIDPMNNSELGSLYPETQDTFSDTIKRIGPGDNISKGYVVPPRYKQKKKFVKPKIIMNFGTENVQMLENEPESQMSTPTDKSKKKENQWNSPEKKVLLKLMEALRSASEEEEQEEESQPGTESPRNVRETNIHPVIQKDNNIEQASEYFTKYTQYGPLEPKIVVTYTFPNFGSIQQPYHFVSIIEDTILLAYDLRYQGTKFTPQSTIKSGVITVSIGRETYCGHILPFRSVLGYFELLLIAIVPSQTPKEETTIGQLQKSESTLEDRSEIPQDYINENIEFYNSDNA